MVEGFFVLSDLLLPGFSLNTSSHPTPYASLLCSLYLQLTVGLGQAAVSLGPGPSDLDSWCSKSFISALLSPMLRAPTLCALGLALGAGMEEAPVLLITRELLSREYPSEGGLRAMGFLPTSPFLLTESQSPSPVASMCEA